MWRLDEIIDRFKINLAHVLRFTKLRGDICMDGRSNNGSRNLACKLRTMKDLYEQNFNKIHVYLSDLCPLNLILSGHLYGG